MESVHEPGYQADPISPAQKRFAGSWRKVSIRELLLITTAAGAIVALVLSYVQHGRPIQSTGIPERFKDFEQVRVVCHRLMQDPHIQVDEIDAPAPVGDYFYDPHNATYAYATRIWLPDRLHNTFMEEFLNEIKSVLEEHADVAHSGTNQSGALEHFEFGYSVGTTEGRLFVRTLGIETDRIEILLFIHEFDSK